MKHSEVKYYVIEHITEGFLVRDITGIDSYTILCCGPFGHCMAWIEAKEKEIKNQIKEELRYE